jgi:hypothetical protein
VAASGSATLAAARALPGPPPPPAATTTTSSAHGRALHRLLQVEKKSGPGHSCGTNDVHNSCPPPPRWAGEIELAVNCLLSPVYMQSDDAELGLYVITIHACNGSLIRVGLVFFLFLKISCFLVIVVYPAGMQMG